MAISSASTMNVYGRRRARRTIHIVQLGRRALPTYPVPSNSRPWSRAHAIMDAAGTGESRRWCRMRRVAGISSAPVALRMRAPFRRPDGPIPATYGRSAGARVEERLRYVDLVVDAATSTSVRVLAGTSSIDTCMSSARRRPPTPAPSARASRAGPRVEEVPAIGMGRCLVDPRHRPRVVPRLPRNAWIAYTACPSRPPRRQVYFVPCRRSPGRRT